MRLGIYGGTFDPVHWGHLLLAECCREQARLDEVWFLPAGLPPHKQRSVADARQRAEMINLAISGHESFRVSTLEIDRTGLSYTVETLQALTEQHPAAELFFLMGGDSLHDLPNWREPGRICELALPLVTHRAGGELNFSVLQGILPPQRIAQIEAAVVELPEIGISSTDLRQRVASGSSIRYRTPRAVERFIQTHELYRTPVTEQAAT